MAEKTAPPPPDRSGRRKELLSETQPSYEEEEIPTEIGNGGMVTEQTVAPGYYRWYTINIPGNEDDIARIAIERTVQAAATNIFVNYPPSENFPTKELYDWDPTLGPLEGPPGVYRISVQGVASYIEKDDKYLVDENSNWASFSLYVEWELLDEETKEKYKKLREQYSHQNRGDVWSSGYNKEVQDKYKQQQREYEEEQAARENQLKKSEIKLEGTPLAEKYEIGEVLGRGPFSVVKKGKSKSSGKEVAIKVIDKEGAGEAGITEAILKRSTDILKQLDHKNIVKLVESVDIGNALCLVMELHLGEDIFVALSEDPSKPYTEDTARKIVTQLLDAIKYLHQKNIVQGGIMPGNILFSSKGSSDVKLVGFTLSHDVKDEEILSGGDAAFQAPEVINQQSWGKEIDLWQIGIIAYILFSGHAPFQDSNVIRLYSKIRQGKYELPDSDWNNVSNEAKNFVQSLLTVDKEKRLTAEQALEHPWIKGSGGKDLPNVRKNLKSL